MTSESHNTGLGGIKQDIQDFKSHFNSLLSSMKNEIQSKFEDIYTRLNQIKSSLESNITEQVNESILSVKDYYYRFKKVKLAESEKSFNRWDQYNRRNNLEIQGILSAVGDEVLEDKLMEIFRYLNIPLVKSDIEDSHRLGMS